LIESVRRYAIAATVNGEPPEETWEEILIMTPVRLAGAL
jgi:hypothetical protein